jgi:CRP/FNR family cyclic AMP-dependent transcriptional regulator
MVDGCAGCKVRGHSAFCNLHRPALAELERLSFAVSYPEQATLFLEDQPCRGVFILCEGRVKLSARSQDGKSLMLRVAEPGETLGLSAVIGGTPYEICATTMAPSTVRFVKREEFLQFLRLSVEAGQNAVRALSLEYQQAFESLRLIALMHTATGRIAQLLLRMESKTPPEGASGNIRLLLTQEQIAEMTCTTRETVTRFFSQLKRNQVIAVRGASLVIMDRKALEKMAS